MFTSKELPKIEIKESRWDKIRSLQKRLKAMSEEERNLLAEKLGILTIEGRQLSIHNQVLIYFQMMEKNPTIVGGFKQWNKAGRIIRKGEHGAIILFPVKGSKNDDNDEDIEIKFHSGIVFDISQTEEKKGVQNEL